MGKKIVIVTGGCGRIGSQVIRRLSGEYDVFCLEHPKAPWAENIIRVDISSDESVEKAFAQIPHRPIASVIHLAAYYSFDQKNSDLYETITVRGTERILKALQNFEVDQFLFSSTMLVHAPTQPGCPITEDFPFKLAWGYPISKVRTEQLIHKLRGIPNVTQNLAFGPRQSPGIEIVEEEGSIEAIQPPSSATQSRELSRRSKSQILSHVRYEISSVILRIAGVYDDHCHSIPISHQIQRIYERNLEARVFSGNIHHGASFVHMEDVIDAIELAVEKRKELPAESTFLIGEPTTLSYDELQRIISHLIWGKVFKTWRVPKPIAKIGAWVQGWFGNPFIKPWMIDLADDHYELDISRAQKMLGWNPKHRLEDTLPKMIEELKADPDAWYKANQLK